MTRNEDRQLHTWTPKRSFAHSLLDLLSPFTISPVTPPVEKRGRSRRKVNFMDIVRVVLIPTRREFDAAGVHDQIWWGHQDYGKFMEDAQTEYDSEVLGHDE